MSTPQAEPSAERQGQAIVVRATTDVPAPALFALLADPRRHPELDGSGMVRAAPDAQPITAVGQVFTMAMHYSSLGDYRTENHVLAVQPDHLLAWTTANVGQPPAGVRWSWELGRDGAGRTTVTHTYDWSGVTDPAVLARVSFPRVPAEALVESVRRLVAAAG
ncbi:SRPBCC family protein [Rhodococcus aerolatus]